MGVGIGGGGQFACFSSGQGGSGSLDFTLSNWLGGVRTEHYSWYLLVGECVAFMGSGGLPNTGPYWQYKGAGAVVQGQGARLMENEGINGRSFVQDWLL